MRHNSILVLLALLCWTGVAAADILVTSDGTVIETRGPWQQRGRMVIFTLENGQLSALRADDVDFEATERQREAVAAGEQMDAAAPSAAAPKARIIITDADVRHVQPTITTTGAANDGGSAEDGQDSGAGSAGEDHPSQVRVIAWDQEDPADGDGRLIVGTLRNDGNTFAADISLDISIYDDDGKLAASQKITPIKSTLRPGESTTFRTQFRELYEISAARMIVSSLELDISQQAVARDAAEL